MDNNNPIAATELALPLEAVAQDAPIDLSGCNVLTISCALLDHEKVESCLPDRWPYEVRSKIEQQLTEWTRAHPDRLVRLLSTGFDNRCCFVMAHHCKKAA